MNRYPKSLLPLLSLVSLLTLPACTTSPQTQRVSCPTVRPQICTREYRPVCGYQSTTHKTYATGCVACADPAVNYYIPGPCPDDTDGLNR